jgi:diguanylate cyclase (GGDEF)-like protein
VELLYVVEATSASMAETRKLADRLRAGKFEAESQAMTDALTGLGNRRGMDIALDRIAARAEPFAVMQIDLDHFKAVNDTHGHAAGDAVLVAVAERLRATVRRRDRLFRLGGDEFAVILRGEIDAHELAPLAERVIEEIEKPIEHAGAACGVSASIGIAIWPNTHQADGAWLLEEADRALYRSKAAGRGRPTFAE